MYEYDEDLKPKKNHNTLWIVLALLLTLFIGLTLGYVFRENQAEESITETIQSNQQENNENVENDTPTEPITPTEPAPPETPVIEKDLTPDQETTPIE
jgi:flagellar basal body-associated protein FliL